MLLPRILLCGVALAACTASTGQSGALSRADRELAKALEGRIAGEATDCINLSMSNGPQVIDKDTILYREMGKVWRNELPETCPGMERMDTLIVEVHGSQLCRNDRFRATRGGERIPGPYCRFGKFVPYTKAK